MFAALARVRGGAFAQNESSSIALTGSSSLLSQGHWIPFLSIALSLLAICTLQHGEITGPEIALEYRSHDTSSWGSITSPSDERSDAHGNCREQSDHGRQPDHTEMTLSSLTGSHEPTMDKIEDEIGELYGAVSVSSVMKGIDTVRRCIASSCLGIISRRRRSRKYQEERRPRTTVC